MRPGMMFSVIARQEVTEPHRPSLALLTGAEDEGLDIRGGDPIAADSRSTRAISQSLDAHLPIPQVPHVELAPRDPEDVARQRAVPGNLLVVLAHPHAGPCPVFICPLPVWLLRPGPPSDTGQRHGIPGVRESVSWCQCQISTRSK